MNVFMSAAASAFTISPFNVPTIPPGVAAGATIPQHEVASKPGTVSATAGTSGSDCRARAQ